MSCLADSSSASPQHSRSRPEMALGRRAVGNLDRKSSAELLTFMRRAVDEFGQTIVMVTHDANAASYADRVVFLADGKQSGRGDRSDVRSDPPNISKSLRRLSVLLALGVLARVRLAP